jgi:hypothetical protein
VVRNDAYERPIGLLDENDDSSHDKAANRSRRKRRRMV